MTPAEIFQVVDLIALFRLGLPPVQGGTLDQSQSFIDAATFVNREEDEIEQWARSVRSALR